MPDEAQRNALFEERDRLARAAFDGEPGYNPLGTQDGEPPPLQDGVDLEAICAPSIGRCRRTRRPTGLSWRLSRPALAQEVAAVLWVSLEAALAPKTSGDLPPGVFTVGTV